MFPATKPEAYFIAREAPVPPSSLARLIFPWAEDEMDCLAVREQQNPKAKDISLRKFLELLVWFWTVILQDCAALYIKDTTLGLWDYAPFNKLSFRQFAKESIRIVSSAEEAAALAVHNLPEHISNSITGALAHNSMQQQQLQCNLVSCEESLSSVLDLGENAGKHPHPVLLNQLFPSEPLFIQIYPHGR